jgi:hypothetical protein
MALAGDRYPLASADSSTLARNHKGSRSRRTPRRPAKRAARAAARQCPALWQPARPQLALVGVETPDL